MNSNAENSKDRSTIKLERGLYVQLQNRQDDARRANGKKPTVTEVIQALLDGSSTPTAAAVSHATDKWHEMLTAIQQSGDEEAIAAIEYNLKVFLRVAKKRTPRPVKS